MADKLGLDYDEVVILQETSVAHGGVMAIYTDELILTNKKIICLHKGMFGGTKQTYHYPLDQIKVFNGIPQVQQGKLSNGTLALTVYLLSGEEQFNFQGSNKKTIDKWIAEIKKLFGCAVETANESKAKRKKGRIEIDDDSVIGAFKEVGSEFKDVGKELVSAFGIKFRDKNTAEDNENEEDNDAVEYKYQPDSDEIIILSNADVSVYGDMECNAEALLLTNKKIVIEYSSGFFNNQMHIDTFDLAEIKRFKNIPQVRLCKYDDEPALDVFFANSHLIFSFDNEGNKKKQIARIEKWVRSVNEAIVEFSPKKEVMVSHNVCRTCGAELTDEDVFCTNCGAKVEVLKRETERSTGYIVCQKCGAQVESGLNFCMECGTPVKLPVTKEEPKQEHDVKIRQPEPEEKKNKISIDQQIELLQKLKALVDAGVLSQEEFEQKKKEIL